MAITYIEQDRTFWLDTEHTSYLLAIVDQENFVGHVYYGQKLQYTGTGIFAAYGRSTLRSDTE